MCCTFRQKAGEKDLKLFKILKLLAGTIFSVKVIGDIFKLLLVLNLIKNNSTILTGRFERLTV